MGKPKQPRKPDHISQEDWDAVDSPEWTAEDFKNARPAIEVVPEIVAAYRRGRGKQKAPTKVMASIRFDRDVLDRFKQSGRGWLGRVYAALRLWLKRHDPEDAPGK